MGRKRVPERQNCILLKNTQRAFLMLRGHRKMVTFGAPGRNLKNGPGAWTIIFPVAFKKKLPRGSPPKRLENSETTTLAGMLRRKTRPWLALTPWASLEMAVRK